MDLITKSHFSYYSREGNKVINNITSPLNIDDLDYRGIMWKFTMTLKNSMKGYVDD